MNNLAMRKFHIILTIRFFCFLLFLMKIADQSIIVECICSKGLATLLLKISKKMDLESTILLNFSKRVATKP